MQTTKATVVTAGINAHLTGMARLINRTRPTRMTTLVNMYRVHMSRANVNRAAATVGIVAAAVMVGPGVSPAAGVMVAGDSPQRASSDVVEPVDQAGDRQRIQSERSTAGPYAIDLEDQADEHGLSFVYAPTLDLYGFDSWMSGGGAVGDFNNNGYPDVFVLGGATQPDRLYINHGDGAFTDQAEQWGVAVKHAGVGAAAGDYTGNGYLDLYVTSLGDPDSGPQPGRNLLYRNNGDGTFTEVAEEAGVNVAADDLPNANGVSWGDYTLNGHLDLFIACWLEEAQGNRLYRNNGDGTFTDVTHEAGVFVEDMWGFQGRFTDMNSNGWPDLLVAADFETSRYFRNNGDGTFTDITEQSGTGLDAFGMGTAVADFNNNGLLDWYVTSVYVEPSPPWNEGNMLYLNQGEHQYEESAAEAGVLDGGWGWGAVPADLNNNGHVDIVTVNGRPGTAWSNDRPRLFRNNGDGTFDNIASEIGMGADEGRGIVAFDANRDGRLDILIFNNNQPLLFYRNVSDAGNWLHVRLDTSNHPFLAPDGFGARIIATVGSQSYLRHIDGNPSYLSAGEPAAHFGLADAEVIDELRIQWPRGYVTTLHNVRANQHLVIESPALGDLTADGTVGADDLAALIERWGPVEHAHDLMADLNNDGVVDGRDLGILLSRWGQ